MKVFDTFTYFNENMILDIRLNELNAFVDKFVIVESTFTHSGEAKKLNFRIENFKKFSDKIIYVIIDDVPKNYLRIGQDDKNEIKTSKEINNALILENYQRNSITKGLNNADENDLILMSDVDEIPNLQNLNLRKISSKILIFNQYFFHYKLNLYLKDLRYFGTKGCLKKNLKSPQWLRNIKNKKYNFFRIDTLFSNKKYTNISFINNGGWHFSNVLNEDQIIYKLKSYLHHADFPKNLLNKNLFTQLIKERKVMYDHEADKGDDKYSTKKDLTKIDFKLLPVFIKENKKKFDEWLA